jgi:hypothetical protein
MLPFFVYLHLKFFVMGVTKLKRKAAKNKTVSRLRNQGLTKTTLGSYKNHRKETDSATAE